MSVRLRILIAYLGHLDSFNQFWFNQCDRYRVLDQCEQLELAQTVQASKSEQGFTTEGNAAIDKLIKHNMRLCILVWKQEFIAVVHAGSHLLPDLMQEGCYGLRKAAEKYDPKRGYGFVSYALWWVRRYMREFLYNHDRMIRIPPEAQAIYNNYTNLRVEHSREEAIELVARKRRLKTTSVEQYVDHVFLAQCSVGITGTERSLTSDEPEASGDWSKVFDVIACRAQLDPEEREILLGRYSGMSFEAMEAYWPQITHAQKRYVAARIRFVRAAKKYAAEENLKSLGETHSLEVA